MKDGKFKVFVLNPGSTSTKIELFEDEKSIIKANVFHDSSILLTFPTINDQLDYRMEVVFKWLKDNNADLSGLDAVVGRGGASFPVVSGTYEINDLLINDTKAAKGGVYHSSMLGVQMAERIQKEFGGRMFMVDPIVVDELQDVARFWIDKGVGGFRMDAITYIKKPAAFNDGAPDGEDGMVGIHSMTANTDGILD